MQYLDIELGLLQLEVALLAPELLGLVHCGHREHLNVAIVDDLVAVVFPVDAHLKGFTCKRFNEFKRRLLEMNCW